MRHQSIEPRGVRKASSCFAIAAVAFAFALPASAQFGNRRAPIEFESPRDGLVLTGRETSVVVQGDAALYGEVPKLDLMLVMDTSSSLKDSDPEGLGRQRAIDLVESLPEWSGVRIGLVTFGRKAELKVPLTSQRAPVVAALRAMEYGATTDLAAGVREALDALEASPRPNATKQIVLFSDGKANEKRVMGAATEATLKGVSVHTAVIGGHNRGGQLMEKLSRATDAERVRVGTAAIDRDALLDLGTPGVENVSIRVNGGAPIPAALLLGTFRVEVPLDVGENEIVAQVTGPDGRTRTRRTRVRLRPDGCAELSVAAAVDGKPALSISKRAVEVVVDASQSMWGQIDGRSKMAIAKEILEDTLGWLPEDLALSLRVYGHQDAPKAGNCRDTELLVDSGTGNRAAIRDAIAGLQPKGQTPLAYAIEQIAADFAGFTGERAVVLVTDGIESCGGDAAAAASALQADGPIPVHVIGFGLGGRDAEDVDSLKAIARASGGRFVTAGNADELAQGVVTTVGTPFRILQNGDQILTGALGSGDVVRMPPGTVDVELASSPPVSATLSLDAEVRHTVVFTRDGGTPSWSVSEAATAYTLCEVAALAPVGESFAAAVTKPSPGEAASIGPEAPTGTQTMSLEASGGTVEVWQDAGRYETIVNHRSAPGGSVVFYSGRSREEAEQAAREARGILFLHGRWIAPAR